jgi:hypothetical protein
MRLKLSANAFGAVLMPEMPILLGLLNMFHNMSYANWLMPRAIHRSVSGAAGGGLAAMASRAPAR